MRRMRPLLMPASSGAPGSLLLSPLPTRTKQTLPLLFLACRPSKYSPFATHTFLMVRPTFPHPSSFHDSLRRAHVPTPRNTNGAFSLSPTSRELRHSLTFSEFFLQFSHRSKRTHTIKAGPSIPITYSRSCPETHVPVPRSSFAFSLPRSGVLA